jgi:hypothetical protein
LPGLSGTYGNGPGACSGKIRVPADETKRVLLEFIADLLCAVPAWLETTIASMNEAVHRQQAQLPSRIEGFRKQQAELTERRR